MKVYKSTIWWSFLICFLSVLLGVLTDNDNIKSIMFGVFSSSLLVFVSFLVNYYVEKRRIMHKILLSLSNIKLINNKLCIVIKNQNIKDRSSDFLNVLTELYISAQELSDLIYRQFMLILYSSPILKFFCKSKHFNKSLFYILKAYRECFKDYYDAINNTKVWYEFIYYSNEKNNEDYNQYVIKFNSYLEKFCELSLPENQHIKVQDIFIKALTHKLGNHL